MHIPDGLMDPVVWMTGWIIALVFLAIAVKRIGKLDERTMPLMAILAAGIFVAQMLNFPIGGGTTGHLIGAALATILLGPWAAMLIITVILIIQGLVFGDGGITAMGLNILNMAIVAPLVTWGVLGLFGNNRTKLSVPIAAWTSVFVASLVCAFELAFSFTLSGGAYGINGIVAFPTMAGYHLLIATGEAIITAGIVLYISAVDPGMLKIKNAGTKEPVRATEKGRGYRLATIVVLIAFAVGLAGFFAVSNGLPDGLTKTMQDSGVKEATPVYNALLSYGNNYVTALVMGIVGFILTLVVMYGILKLRKAAKDTGDH